MIIPVRIFDDDLHLRIDGLCRTYHQILGCIVHQGEPIFCPRLLSFGCNLHRTLAAGEEEIVEQKLVEMACSHLCNVLYCLAMLGIRVAEGLKLIGLVDGVGDTACHLNALFLEKLLGLLQCSVIDNQQVTMGLEIDLVNIQLTGDGGPCRLQPLGILHLVDLIGTHIHRHLKIVVLCLYGSRHTQASHQP